MFELPTWLALDLYCMAMLGLMIFYYSRQVTARTFQRRYLFTMLLYTLMLFCYHAMGHLATPDQMWLGMIGNFAALAFDVGMILFWFAYIEIWVKGDAADSDRKHGMSRSAMSWAIRILFIVHIVINVIGLRTGWFFYYDAAGAYHRGPYFNSHAVLMVIMTVMVEAYLFRYRHRLLPSAVPFLAVFPVAPFVFGMLQMTMPGLPLEFVGFTFSLSLLHFFVQNRDANTDFLTGVGNRRQLDVALESRVQRATSGIPFGGVMCDLDRFKQINDTYGHNQGDETLEAVADVLARSFRHNDMVARYGGDEFFVITEIRDPRVLQNAIGRVRANLDDLNGDDRLPFEVSISMGYGIFDPEVDGGVPGFRARLDEMLYEEKKAKAAATGNDAYLDRGRDGVRRGGGAS